MTIETRVKIRKPEIDTGLLTELVKAATDRIKLRVGQSILPSELESIAVEVVCAMYNRSQSHNEGVKSENIDTFSVSFVEDILKEYEADFSSYLVMKEKQEKANRGVLRFL